MAPELIMQNYGEKADVWSVGMLTYQLLTGHFPYWNDITKCSLKQLWHAVVNEDVDLDRWDLVNKLSAGARDFLKTMLVRDPNGRCSALQVGQNLALCCWRNDQSRTKYSQQCRALNIFLTR